MKKSKIKLGFVIFTCIALFPLFMTEANAALDPGPPTDPPPVTTVVAQANLDIYNGGSRRFLLVMYISANVLDGVRLDHCIGVVTDYDTDIDNYGRSLLTLYHDFYYLAGTLWKYRTSWVYRVNKYENGVIESYFDFTFYGEINIVGEYSFGVSDISEGGGDSVSWNFDISQDTGNFAIAMDIWINYYDLN